MKLDFSQEDLTLLAKALAPEVAKELRPLLQVKDKGNPSLFTVESLAQYLGVQKSFIYEKVHRREIPFVRVGRLPRFRKKDIDSWLETTYIPPNNGNILNPKGGVV